MLRDNTEKFQELDTQVLGIVPHERTRAAAWDKLVKGKFPILADGGFLASSTYGVAFQCRVHAATSNTPASFLIDRNGDLAWYYIARGPKNFGDRPDVETLLAAVRKLTSAE